MEIKPIFDGQTYNNGIKSEMKYNHPESIETYAFVILLNYSFNSSRVDGVLNDSVRILYTCIRIYRYLYIGASVHF